MVNLKEPLGSILHCREYPQGSIQMAGCLTMKRGTNDDLLPMMAADISSADFDIDPAGDQFMLVRRITPDLNFTGTTYNTRHCKNDKIQPRNFSGR